MVHALEQIRCLLKPTGTLIDIHPIAASSPIEIHQGEKIELVGYLSVRQWCLDYQQADNALSEIMQRGLFAIEREKVFDSLTHYATLAEMRTALKEAIHKFARDAQSVDEAMPHAEALAAKAEELIQSAASEAELIVREPTHISRLRPT